MRADGLGGTLLPAGGDSWAPVWSPDGTRLAFLSDRLGRISLFVGSPAGQVIDVGSTAGTDSQPAWSPDGTEIAFTNTTAGNTDLWISVADGSGRRRLTRSADAESSPSWSPDGSTIAYARNGSVHGVWTIHPDGSADQPLHVTARPAARPRWAPGGNRLAFLGAGCATGKYALYVVDRDGSGAIRLACGSLLSDSHQTWSPDGHELLLERAGVIAGRWIRQAAIAVPSARRAFPSTVAAGAPVWAPDGTGVAGIDSASRVVVSRPSGLDRLVVHGATRIGGQEVSWQPLACTISGTSGPDHLAATSAPDVVCALGGNDQVRPNGTGDHLSGGDGVDTLDLSGRSTSATVALFRGLLEGGASSARSFENIIGTRSADNLSGDQLPNRIDAGGGNDHMIGGAGRDTLLGGTGADVLDARDGHGGDVAGGGTGPDVCLTDRGDTRSACAPPLSSLHLHSVPWLTLGQLSRCFSAAAPGGWWPLVNRLARHPVRSGFNDPRGGSLAHFGVDVEAPDRAPAYAINGGVIGGDVRRGTWDEAFRISRYAYYHVNLPPSRGDGTYVTQGGEMGRIHQGMRHVHVSEIDPSCGLVDPRRPTGVLHDRADTERPLIGGLSAYVANAVAYAPFRMGQAVTADHSTRLYLGFLHGVVDLRANVADVPAHRTTYAPQQQLMVAGVRAYLAPLGHPYTAVGRAIVPYRGATLIPPPVYFHVMARPTRYIARCEYDNRLTCNIHLVLHVAGTGLDTRAVPNGDYQFCVTAVTIANHAAIHCTPVTIWNPRSGRRARPGLARPRLPTASASARILRQYACLNAQPASALAKSCGLPSDGEAPLLR